MPCSLANFAWGFHLSIHPSTIQPLSWSLSLAMPSQWGHSPRPLEKITSSCVYTVKLPQLSSHFRRTECFEKIKVTNAAQKACHQSVYWEWLAYACGWHMLDKKQSSLFNLTELWTHGVFTSLSFSSKKKSQDWIDIKNYPASVILKLQVLHSGIRVVVNWSTQFKTAQQI